MYKMAPMTRKLLSVITTVISVFLLYRIVRAPGQNDETQEFAGYKDCNKKQKIAFLKTHKCASSSVQNILMRFGLNNQLDFVLPSAGNYLGRYVPYSKVMVANTPWDRVGVNYDIFCLHTIWNYREVEATLGPGAIYVTIMRDPVELFESLWSYAGLDSFYNTDLESFALEPKEGKLATRAYRNLGRNQMLWDTGLTSAFMDNKTAVDNKIAEIDSTFHLVMMADRFDESMVLLKDLLCWDFADVVNFKLNARKESKKIPLSEEAKAALKEYLAPDYKMYNHFKEKFEAKIHQFGQSRMSQELTILRHANDKMKKKCGIKKTDNDKVSGPNKLWGQGMVGYTAQDETAEAQCKWFAVSENTFIDHLRDVQAEKAKEMASDLNIDLSHIEDNVYSLMKRLPNIRDGFPDIEKLKNMYVHS